MKIRINDLVRNRVDGIERMDQVERKKRIIGQREEKGKWMNLIYDEEQGT